MMTISVPVKQRAIRAAASKVPGKVAGAVRGAVAQVQAKVNTAIGKNMRVGANSTPIRNRINRKPIPSRNNLILLLPIRALVVIGTYTTL